MLAAFFFLFFTCTLIWFVNTLESRRFTVVSRIVLLEYRNDTLLTSKQETLLVLEYCISIFFLLLHYKFLEYC